MKKIALILACLLLLPACNVNPPESTDAHTQLPPVETADPTPTALNTAAPETTLPPEPTETPYTPVFTPFEETAAPPTTTIAPTPPPAATNSPKPAEPTEPPAPQKEPLLTGDEELDAAVAAVLDGVVKQEMSVGQRLKAAYSWVQDKITYKYIDVDVSGGYTDELIKELAKYAMEKRKGSCEHYAVLLYVLFRHLGYESVLIEGQFPQESDGSWTEHLWVIVEADGVYRHCDPLYARNHTKDRLSFFMKKDADIESKHRWDADKYPVCE